MSRRERPKKPIVVYHVRVGDRYVVGFRYPPADRVLGECDLDEFNERRVAPQCIALLGTYHPHEWTTETAENSAAWIAEAIGGTVEAVEK